MLFTLVKKKKKEKEEEKKKQKENCQHTEVRRAHLCKTRHGISRVLLPKVA
jgi:ribosomal protein S14